MRMTRDLPRYRQEIERMGDDADMAKRFDVPRLKALLDSWPDKTPLGTKDHPDATLAHIGLSAGDRNVAFCQLGAREELMRNVPFTISADLELGMRVAPYIVDNSADVIIKEGVVPETIADATDGVSFSANATQLLMTIPNGVRFLVSGGDGDCLRARRGIRPGGGVVPAGIGLGRALFSTRAAAASCQRDNREGRGSCFYRAIGSGQIDIVCRAC